MSNLMKKGKPPRRRCPHLGLTVVRQAGSSILLGTGLCEQKQWGVPGEMAGGPRPRVPEELVPGNSRWPRGVAERRTKDRGLKGTLSGTWMALPKRNSRGQSFSVLPRHRVRRQGRQRPSSQPCLSLWPWQRERLGLL